LAVHRDERHWVFENLLEPFAVFEANEDHSDFVCLDANAAFARMNGVALSLSKGERVSVMFDHAKTLKEDWMTILKKAFNAEDGNRFKHHSLSSKSVFEVVAHGDGKQCAVLLHDVTASEEEKLGMSTLLASLQEYMQLPPESLDYQAFTDQLVRLSGAKFAALNTYERGGTKTITRAISGPGETIRRAMKTLGFNLIGKEWDVIEERVETIKKNSLLRFDSLYEAASGSISRRQAAIIERLINLGESYVLQITKGKEIIGDFMLFMPKGQPLKNPEIVQIYANQVAIMILRQKAAKRIRYLSYHDALTGLYNRAYLEEAIQRYEERGTAPLSVIMADLDGLKLTNDVFGHDTGDRMLNSFAAILKDVAGGSALIGRLGGDEFIILLEAGDERKTIALAEKIKQRSEETMVEAFPISASVGTGVRGTAAASIEGAIQDAEDAMYHEKFSNAPRIKHAHVDALFESLKAKSYESDAHINTMWRYAERMAVRLDMSEREKNRLHTAIKWHDVGKSSIDEETLVKASPLTDEEWQRMKEHPETGYRIAMTTQKNVGVALDILSHHERFDGRGYPQGLEGEEIPLNARIIAIVDAYEVMRSGRPYNGAKSHEAIVDEFTREKGAQFDPELVDIFLNLLREEDA